MAKYVDPSVEDAAIIKYKTCTEMYFCNGQPVSRADAIAKQSAAVIPLTAADFTGPVNGGTAGTRQVTIAGKTATSTVNQNTDHIALTDGVTLLLVTTIPVPAAVSVGGTYTSQPFVETVGPIA